MMLSPPDQIDRHGRRREAFAVMDGQAGCLGSLGPL
jgi:hypothetical protein